MIAKWTPKYLRGQTLDACEEFVLVENVPGVWSILVYPEMHDRKTKSSPWPLNNRNTPDILSEEYIWEEITKEEAFILKLCSKQDIS